jgi:hypothetical protein
MDPINICRFDGLTKTHPAIYELKSLEELVEFFTSKEPPTVKKEERNDFFSMVAYKPDTTRAKENVKALSAMVLDFDNTEDGQLKLPKFIEQLKQLDLIYLYYTTWSHTELRHRWRLILPFAKAIEPNFWPEAHARIINLLGNPIGLDKSASKDVSRMWIMPCKSEGGAYEVGYEIAGKFLDPHTLPPTAKTTLPLVIPSEYRETTSEDIREALNRIDAGCDYDTWLEMGMALHHELGNSGFAIWNNWSARNSEKYEGIESLNKKWNSFKSGGGVTIATLFMHARNAGWQPTSRSNPITYVITTGTSDSANAVTEKPSKVENQIVVEEFEEADEFIDPVDKCLDDLEPFAVSDIFDFPCPILKSTYDWVQSVAPAPIPIFSLSASLSLLAFLKKDAVISTTDLRTNLYILVIGPSRSGKNNGLGCISAILKALDKRGSLASAIGSSQGLIDALCKKENCVYWAQDEISHIFQNFQNRNAGTHETRLEQQLLTLYNCNYITTDKIKGEEIQGIENPYLNVYGTATENIINKLNPEAAVSGLLARFLVFWLKPDYEPSERNTNINKSIPHKLLEELSSIKCVGKIVSFDDSAKEWFRRFSKVTQTVQRELRCQAAKVDSLVGNLGEQSIKLALLVAKAQRIEIDTGNSKAEYDDAIKITLKDIQWAVSVAIHCLKNNLDIAGLLTENKNEKHINKILEYLAAHTGKWVKRANICRHLRYAINARQLDDLLEPLLESKQIIKTPSKKGGGSLYLLNPTLNKRKIR